ncbi:unnamed protein product [Urochloa decumbens]|uniref:SnoaL-like domain-containing protein n=1 Tax=Urochloa decumbens TaxID=240449 RepID=A0ABC8YWD5_9POAL
MDGVRALIAAGATAVCCLASVCAFWAFRSSSSPSPSPSSSSKTQQSPSPNCCGCASCGCRAAKSVNGEMAVGGENKKKAQEQDPPEGGASMMEQLVPEITTHALSYLDCTSLCRLSMTNSAMRRAANDDGAWKALYHKDFTVEQDYVKCIHANGEFLNGYNAVMARWSLLFNWGQDGGQGVAFQIRDVRVRVLGEVAWVYLKANVNLDPMMCHVTNVFEFHNGRWYMVHHHSSLMAVPAPHNMFG